ncbi:MAG: NAD(P)-binding domain-containing protein [candidate division WOR-3 bacterium]|nr:NAD(P)-binding domain-containing protein [candidate division WOR-3 bacterium]MDW8150499.1 NAD(P)-binding domain-containing protein [candidate division WOR-3 bacterium]
MLGLIGLGRMGRAISLNLISKGLKLNLYNRSKEKLEEFREKANLFYNIDDFVKNTDIILIVLSDTKAVSDIIKSIPDQKIIIDFSTLHPVFVEEIKEKYKSYVSSPIFGGPKDIETARARIVFGESEDFYQRYNLNFLEYIGKVYFVNDSVKASAIKLASNFIHGVFYVLSLEFNTFIKEFSIENEIYEIQGDRPIIDMAVRYGKYYDKEVELSFTTELMAKDIEYARISAHSKNIPFFITSSAREFYELAKRYGLSTKDWRETWKLFKKTYS